MIFDPEKRRVVFEGGALVGEEGASAFRVQEVLLIIPPVGVANQQIHPPQHKCNGAEGGGLWVEAPGESQVFHKRPSCTSWSGFVLV